MHITADYLQEKQDIATRPNLFTGENVSQVKEKGPVNGIEFSFGKNKTGIGAYEKQKSTFQKYKQEAMLTDAGMYKRYMTVMAQTMSKEDFSKMVKEGVHPGKVDPRDAVTIMDHIKAEMAKGGVVISGFNGQADIDPEVLQEITKDAGYAQSLYASFNEQNLPLNEDIAKESVDSFDKLSQLTQDGLKDDAKAYLLQNELAPSVENIYLASHSGITSQSEAGNSYFIDQQGYVGKRSGDQDFEQIKGQVEAVIKKAGLEANEKTMQEAKWLMDKEICLTEDNLLKLHEMNETDFPMTKEAFAKKIAGGVEDGFTPMSTDLCAPSVKEQAIKSQEALSGIEEKTVAYAASLNQELTIRNLTYIQAQEEIKEYASLDEKQLKAVADLQSARLYMSVSANISLLKTGISIDTKPLSQLVDALKDLQDEKIRWGLTTGDKDSDDLLAESISKTQELKEMPAGVLAKAVNTDTFLSIRMLHKEGSALRDTYEKQNQSYEALMTKPRQDLGDRISKAFQNVDDLLKENGLEINKDNQRAVRILAYNQMDITYDHIVKVRTADQTVNELFDKMTPAATLQMIRDGINPLEEDIDTLHEYFDKQETSFEERSEKYSHFLYQMEQKKEISPQERESYIGIYRLMTQIQNTDDRAIGRLIADNRELSLSNLLSALRTGQNKGMDYSVNDEFGAVNSQQKGKSISDQIGSYYQHKTGEFLSMATPEMIERSQITMDSTLGDLVRSLDQLKEESFERINDSQEYAKRQYDDFKSTLADVSELEDTLFEENVSLSTENMASLYLLTKEKSDTFQKLDHAKFEETMDKVWQQFEGKEEAMQSYEQMTKDLEEVLNERMNMEGQTSLDIRELSLLSKQLSVASKMARKQTYEMPAYVQGQLVNMKIQIKDENADRPNAKVNVSLPNGGQVLAQFVSDESQIKGYIATTDLGEKDMLLEKVEKFKEDILSKTGKEADIMIIQSDTVSETGLRSETFAGKQMRSDKTAELTEQGSTSDTSSLYQTVKMFMMLLA